MLRRGAGAACGFLEKIKKFMKKLYNMTKSVMFILLIYMRTNVRNLSIITGNPKKVNGIKTSAEYFEQKLKAFDIKY